MSIVIQGNALALDPTATTLGHVAHLLCQRAAAPAPAVMDDLDDPTSIDIPLARPVARDPRRGAIRLPQPQRAPAHVAL